LLAGAATLPTSVILIIFGSLGVGMAAPYLVLSAKPGLVEKLPRTGPASELVKQVMGLLLLAAAAYFIGSGLIALVSERPWMARQLHWWAVALFGAAAGVWLLVRTVQITSKAAPRFVFTIVAVVIGAVGVLYAMDSTAKARENYQDRAAAIAAAGGEGQLITTTWIDYSPELLERARSEGYIVVLDFTAEWCLNCKALKAAVLNREPVKSALASDRIISMTVDLTSTKAPGWEKLRELGQTGIPLLVVYGPGLDEPWQSNAYTAQQVMDALEAARDDSNVPES
jgi:thiol:disulfide interchange protein